MSDHAARRGDLDDLYLLLGELGERSGGPRRLTDPDLREGCPRRGVYFFFETRERREDGVTPRVVRVGTHALRTGSATTVWQRLSQHRGTLAGARLGGGKHRGSVFRLHVGTV